MGSGIRNIHLCEIVRKSKLKSESAMNKSEWRKEMTVKLTMKITAVGITITDSWIETPREMRLMLTPANSLHTNRQQWKRKELDRRSMKCNLNCPHINQSNQMGVNFLAPMDVYIEVNKKQTGDYESALSSGRPNTPLHTSRNNMPRKRNFGLKGSLSSSPLPKSPMETGLPLVERLHGKSRNLLTLLFKWKNSATYSIPWALVAPKVPSGPIAPKYSCQYHFVSAKLRKRKPFNKFSV